MVEGGQRDREKLFRLYLFDGLFKFVEIEGERGSSELHAMLIEIFPVEMEAVHGYDDGVF